MMTNLPTVKRQWMVNCAQWDSRQLDSAAALQPPQQHVGHPWPSGVL